MSLRAHWVGGAVLAAAMTMVAAASVAAQPAANAPAGMQGLQVNRDKPIQINATTLEVRDKDKRATFIGNVNVVQGDTTMKCKVLDVFYDQDGAGTDGRAGTDGKKGPDGKKGGPAATGGEAGSGAQQQIRRLEAKGGVTVIQKEQTATGENAVYDVKTNTVTLIGNVVVTQGQNVIRGDRITVDMTTGVTRVESGTAGESRVQGLFLPNSAKDANKDANKGAPKTTPKQGANHPLKLN